MYKNSTQYSATFTDSNGNLLKSTEVQFNINGIFYSRKTNGNGVARLNINLNPGTYILTAENPSNGEKYTSTVTVLSTIADNNDLVKYYKNASGYHVKILDGSANPLKGAVVKFNINGIFYTKTSNSNGVASLSINLPPGEYVITSEFNTLKASNIIKVLPVMISNDLKMKYRDGSGFNITILDGQGKAYPSQRVTFNINGMIYTKTTNSNGVAKLSINLMAGEYIITSTYNGLSKANKITITN